MNEVQRLAQENRQLRIQIFELEKKLNALTQKVKSISESTYNTSAREIINHEVQFLQKVYDKDGNVVTEINT